MHTTSPVATAQPQSDLDTMAYGGPAYYPAPAVAPPSDSGGAIAALRASFAASAPRAYLRPGPGGLCRSTDIRCHR
jgi:polysaccharide export outer membrane protein